MPWPSGIKINKFAPVAQRIRATDFKKEPAVWNIKKIISKGDYNYALIPNHPNCTENGYVLEHRAVMENYLGRLLDTDELVHHLDENRKHNDINNLDLCLKGEHERMHTSRRGSKMVRLRCPYCATIFDRRLGQTYLQKSSEYTCCSRTCRAKFNRQIQVHGRTAAVERAISGNLVSLFHTNDDNPEQTA